MNLDDYSQLLVVAVTNDQYSVSLHHIKDAHERHLKTRNLSLTKAYNSDKCYSENRQSATAIRGDRVPIEDITSTQFQIIDSLSKVWLVLKDRTGFQPKEIELIDVLLKWNTLSLEQK
jgi:hypothetical protein